MKMEGPYWVYTHTTPDGMVYVGYSSKKYTCDRWSQCYYKNTSLEPFIEEFGWENIEHFFIDGIQTKESAMKLEGDLIKMYSEIGCCINERDSGGLSIQDRKEYSKQYYQKNKEELKKYKKKYQKEYNKKYREEHKEKIKEYQKQYQKQYNKQYQEEHKKEIKEYQKQYKKEHKEKLKEYQKQYRKKKKLLKQIKSNGSISLF